MGEKKLLKRQIKHLYADNDRLRELVKDRITDADLAQFHLAYMEQLDAKDAEIKLLTRRVETLNVMGRVNGFVVGWPC